MAQGRRARVQWRKRKIKVEMPRYFTKGSCQVLGLVCMVSSPAWAQSSDGGKDTAEGPAPAGVDRVSPDAAADQEEGTEGARAREEPTTQSASEGFSSRDPEASLSSTELQLLRNEIRELKDSLQATQNALGDFADEKSEDQKKKEAEAPLKTLSKGNFYLGGTFGLSYKSKDNIETLFGTVDDGHRVRTNIDGLFGRVLIENQLAVGMLVTYEHSSKTGSIADPDTGAVDQQQSSEYGISTGPAIRQFLPLGLQNRLFIYYQAALTFGYTEKVSRSFLDTSSTVSSSNGYSLGLAVQPGVMLAVSDHFAIEMGINLLGIDYTHYKTTTDYETEGTEDDASVTVDVNLLSLQFAFVGYF